MKLIKKVIPACRWVAQQELHVRINHDNIPAYATLLLTQYPLVTQLDPQAHYISDDREKMASYVLALDSINFGSGYFHLCRGLEYNKIAGGLKGAFEREEFHRPEQWAVATPEYLSRLLFVSQGEHPLLDKLLALFAQHLQWTGERIIAAYQGKVLDLLEEAAYSATELADIVAEWESFRDVSLYKGREVPFLKRAQILAADMHLALGGFRDMDRLTIFADNMVPHVLRYDGIIEYDDALSDKVNAGDFIPAGSEEEVEIRAAAIYAVELIKQAAHRQGYKVTAVNLDHILWKRGYEPEIYKKPVHRTLTTAY